MRAEATRMLFFFWQKVHPPFESPALGSLQHPVYHLSRGSNSKCTFQTGWNKAFSASCIHSFKNHFLSPRCCEQGLVWQDKERNQAQPLPCWIIDQSHLNSATTWLRDCEAEYWPPKMSRSQSQDLGIQYVTQQGRIEATDGIDIAYQPTLK